MPDFKLIDQNGQPIRLSDFRGKAVVLTFIYTRCPIPNFCPLMSKNFAELQGRLEKEFAGRYQLLSVSMDPKFDRPAVLKEYASRYGCSASSSTLWIVQQTLQSRRQFRRETLNPISINQSDLNQVAQVGAVFVTKCGEFHSDECVGRFPWLRTRSHRAQERASPL